MQEQMPLKSLVPFVAVVPAKVNVICSEEWPVRSRISGELVLMFVRPVIGVLLQKKLVPPEGALYVIDWNVWPGPGELVGVLLTGQKLVEL